MSTGLALKVGWYRTRCTLKERWPGYLSLVVLVGLVGGLAMGSVAGARRTQSSFPTFVANSHPPQLAGVVDFVDGQPGPAGLGWDPARLAAIARGPHVQAVYTEAGINVVPLNARGAPWSVPGYPAEPGESSGNTSTAPEGNGAAIAGQLPSASSTDEFVVSPITAQTFRFHIGQWVNFAIYTNAQTLAKGFGTPALRPYRRLRAQLVGIVVNSSDVVQDQVDETNDFLFGFGYKVTAPLLTCCTYYSGSGVLLAGGDRYATAVQKAILALLPKGFSPFALDPGGAIEARAERAIKPESIALGVFGAIAGLAALVIGAQLVGRQLRMRSDDLATLRALGAGPPMIAADGLIGAGAAVVAGALVAAGVAFALSPLAPLGPVRPVYPARGFDADWAVLGLGTATLVVLLGLAAALSAYRLAPHRAEARQARSPARHSVLAAAAATNGLPASTVMGVRFALEPGTGRSSVPVRSAILGAAVAVFVVISTVTFGASLNGLVSHPAQYGWNWDYELTAGEGASIPGQQVAQLLGHDQYVASWSPMYFNTVEVSGQLVPAIFQPAGAAVAPPLLSGHAVDGAGQVVLGALTLAALHVHLGDRVTVRFNGLARTFSAEVVGTATMPTMGVGGNIHTEMGTGALVDDTRLPARVNQPGPGGAAPGPPAVVVRLHRRSAAALRSLQAIAHATTTSLDYGVTVVPVLRPAEIVNYRSMGDVPLFLGMGLAAGAVSALGLTLVASVRRRRRELALLKALGFTSGQLAQAVAWQSTISVVLGTIVALPLGIVAGRLLWDAFAHEISAVPVPSVPVLTLVGVCASALVLANLVAVLPGRAAGRASTADLLRGE